MVNMKIYERHKLFNNGLTHNKYKLYIDSTIYDTNYNNKNIIDITTYDRLNTNN